MGKPHIEVYKAFSKKFFQITKEVGKDQYLIHYLMSSHPGSTLKDAVELAIFLKSQGLHPEQVQDFYPTPGTISTCMFYTGLDPYTLKEIYVPKTAEEKAEQRVLLQYFKKENRDAVEKALRKAGRADLIGNGEGCLIKAAAGSAVNNGADKNKRQSNSKNGKSNQNRYKRNNNKSGDSGRRK